MGSVAISYILKASCSWLHTNFFVDTNFGWSKRAVILCILSFVLSILCAVISERKFVNNISLRINNKSIHNDIWNDVIDYKNGTTLRFVCDNCIYQGVLVEHEENGTDSWFVLEDYIVEEDDTKYSAKEMGLPCKLMIKISEVQRVEMFYGEKQESKIKLWFRNRRLDLKK